MPSVAEESLFHTRANAQHSLSIPLKKRRWEDGRSSSDASSHGDDAVVSLILHDENELLSHKLAAAAATTTSAIRSSIGGSAALLRSPPSPLQRKIIPLGSKRRRLGNCDNSGNVDGSRAKPAKDSSTAANTHVSLMPCHVCQRKPRRKSDLDSQADCEGCGQRACFVCLRECPGWAARGFRDDCGGQTPTEEASEHGLCHISMAPHQGYRKPSSRPWSASSGGHRRIICSRCCVERGQDGEVVCLGCIAS